MIIIDYNCFLRLTHQSISVMETSPIWSNLTSDITLDTTAKLPNLASKTLLASKILICLNDDDNSEVMELDFFGKNYISEAVEAMMEAIILEPTKLYPKILEILVAILNCQPKDTFTQNVLSQIVAIATVPFMASEVKLADLRLSETLMHNLIKVSGQCQPQNEALWLMASIMKDVAPKWRLSVVRKIFAASTTASDGLLAASMITVLPLFAHNLGALAQPLILEILSGIKKISAGARALLFTIN